MYCRTDTVGSTGDTIPSPEGQQSAIRTIGRECGSVLVMGFLLERTTNMELSRTEEDDQILLENIVDVARLDEEVKGLLAQFEVADDETLAELKMKIKELESLRAEYRSRLELYRKQ
jgi:hypothetical protein